jgi:hypothetical protein
MQMLMCGVILGVNCEGHALNGVTLLFSSTVPP